MIQKIKTIFSIPELREKIFFTFAILVVVRVGAHIPIPGVDANALAGAFDRLQDTLFGLFNMFVGGAFEKASLFSLGIMPYISSSIIIQLMGSVLPYFQRLQKEGEAGRKKNYTNHSLWYCFNCRYAVIWCDCFFRERAASSNQPWFFICFYSCSEYGHWNNSSYVDG